MFSEPLMSVSHNRGAVVSHGLSLRRKQSDLRAHCSALSTIRRAVRMSTPSYRSVTRASQRNSRASLSRHVTAISDEMGSRRSSPMNASEIGGRADTAGKIIAALEKAGVEFIAENGGGAGVRLKKKSRGK